MVARVCQIPRRRQAGIRAPRGGRAANDRVEQPSFSACDAHQTSLAEVDARSLPVRLRHGAVRLLTPFL
jgi:hypothetical protein